MTQPKNDEIRGQVRAHYGSVARGSGATGCSRPECCGPTRAGAGLALGYSPADLSSAPEGANMGLGCGNPLAITALREGETVLDLGSGSGFDCFLAAKQVGPEGRVIGVDMTPDMVSKARRNAEALGATNVDFRLGEIETLPAADDTVDVILSNCVINLSPDKEAVFRQAFRVLRAGGRLAISDVVATAPLPKALEKDVAAFVGCVAGAASVDTLEALLEDIGFENIRVAIHDRSREIVSGWVPGSGAEDYVASANIEATKPGSRSCCNPRCCAPETSK